jgi:hypothetical protein
LKKNKKNGPINKKSKKLRRPRQEKLLSQRRKRGQSIPTKTLRRRRFNMSFVLTLLAKTDAIQRK